MSALIPSAEAAAIRDLVRTASLDETTVKVLRAVEAACDVEGRVVLSWPSPAAVTAVGGRVWLATVREQRDGIWVQVAEWRARVGHEVAVGRGDRLFDVETGQLYEVLTVVPKNSLVGVLYQALTLLRVEGDVL